MAESKARQVPVGYSLLPRPRGQPATFSPLKGPTPLAKYKCILRPAHALDEFYLVDICEKMTVEDMLTVLERTKGMHKKSLMVVKDGRVIPTYAKAMVALPASFLLFGEHLDAVDVCVPEDLSSEVSSITPTLASPSQSSRGGARTARVSQHPRSAMIVWAEDKISREVPGLNMLTVRMLLRAEQRTVSAVLHARSEAQTKEVIKAAYRRAGLTMGRGEHEETEALVTNDMTTALRQQTIIAGQIAERMATLPSIQDIMRLMEAAQAHNAADAVMTEQMTRIMMVLMELRGHIMNTGNESMLTQDFEDARDRTPEQARHWDAWGESWRQGTPTPVVDSSLPPSTQSPTEAQQGEVQNMVVEEVPRGQGEVREQSEVAVGNGAEQEPAQSSHAQEMPTPRRLPLAYAPGGVVASPIQALRNASRSSQERVNRGAATRPFRSGR